jgi:MFS transporter, MHS family, proline/betaine transporter
MMPTFVSLASGTTVNIPMSLAVFCFGACVLFLVGVLAAGETKGTALHE